MQSTNWRIFLMLIMFTFSGLMIEYKWQYELSILYTPYWSGGFLVVAGTSSNNETPAMTEDARLYVERLNTCL